MGTLHLEQARLSLLDSLQCDAVLFGVFQDERPLRGLGGFVDWRLHGRISRMLINGFLSGAANEALLTNTSGRLPVPAVLVYGLGARNAFNLPRFHDIVTKAEHALSGLGVTNMAVGVFGWHREEDLYEQDMDERLRDVIDHLVDPLPGAVTLVLPADANLKEVTTNVRRLSRKKGRS